MAGSIWPAYLNGKYKQPYNSICIGHIVVTVALVPLVRLEEYIRQVAGP